jgi:pyruvate dehydrogenase E1 component alpha subunit
MKHQGVEVDDLPFNPVDRIKDCPIQKLEAEMLEQGLIFLPEIAQMTREIEDKIDAAIKYAQDSPFPTPDMLVTEV